MSTTAILSELYRQLNIPLDKLPYTSSFDRLVAQYREAANLPDATPWSVWTKLIEMRKQERTLPTLRRGVRRPDEAPIDID